MRTMVIGRYGPPEVFEVRESPAPTPKPGEALVRIHAVGVGFADLMQRMGIYPGTPKPPFVPGLEVAGVVERVSTGSPGERPLQVGERVVALPKLSGYAEQVASPAERIFRIPEGISFEEAAAIPVNYLTAYHTMFVMGNLLYQVRIENINWDRRTIFVPDSKTINGVREVPMSDRVLSLLRVRCGSRKEGWVFPSKRSASGHLTTMARRFREARAKAALPKSLVLYCGRHDFGTRVLQKIGNLKLVMQTMGHVDVKTAMKYQHPELDIVRSALNDTDPGVPSPCA